MSESKGTKSFIKGAVVLIVWIGIWTLASRKVGQELLIPSPAVVLQHLVAIIKSGTFFKILSTSLLRVLGGFVSGCVFGVILAVLSALSEWLEAFLRPIVRIASSVPVTSFSILAMLWIPYTYVPVFIAGLLVTPLIYGNVTAGINETDKGLLEVGKVYRFGKTKLLKYIYVPSVLPFFYSGAVTALGMAWKAGVAAEVLALPKNAVGAQMYYSKLYLETADLFAWTVVVVLFSYLFEKLVQLFMQKRSSREEADED